MKKVISIILLLSLLLLGLSACKKDNGTDDKTVENSVGGTDPVSVTTAEISDEIPDLNFNGDTLQILCRNNSFSYTCRHLNEIDVEAETGELLDDAVYNRNRKIEDRFNCKLKIVASGGEGSSEVMGLLNKSVKAGDKNYDLVVDHMIYMGVSFFNNLFLPWNEVPHVNFDKPWWIKSASEELSVDGRSFFALSELCYTAYDYTYCMYFNKQLLSDYQLEDPYKLVNEGKWTIDKMISMTKDIYSDLDGDTKLSDGDLYGLSTDTYSAMINYNYAFDNPVTKRNADNIPALVYNTPKVVSMLEKLCDMAFNYPGIYVLKTGQTTGGKNWFEFSPERLHNGQSIFINGMIRDNFFALRSMETPYGIIPYPKWDEAQSRYYTMVDGHGPLIGIPITNDKLEMTGALVEALSAESYKNITPVYYDIALKTKQTRDEESLQMIDLITSGIVYDFGYMYDAWKGVAFCLQDLVPKNDKNFASYYEKREKVITEYYQSIIDLYIDYDSKK